MRTMVPWRALFLKWLPFIVDLVKSDDEFQATMLMHRTRRFFFFFFFRWDFEKSEYVILFIFMKINCVILDLQELSIVEFERFEITICIYKFGSNGTVRLSFV